MTSQPKPVPPEKFYKHWREVPAENWRWPNFTPEEIACRGTGAILVNAQALDKLQHLRTKLGKPLILNSAYRSESHNKKVGGAKASRHLKGDAFDVSMANHIPADFEQAAHSVGFRGFGHYPRQNFMHIDTGSPRRWNQGSWFPTKAVEQTKPVPRFEKEPTPATVSNSILKPEVIVPIGTAIGASGIPAIAQGNGPGAWAIAAVLVIAAGVAGFLILRNRKPKPND